MNSCDVAIIGGGLSGLATALLLQEAGIDFRLLEAGPEFGGRVSSVRDAVSGDVLADLGPSWIWPAYQPSITDWLHKLALNTHDQYDSGYGLFEEYPGTPASKLPFPTQHGIARIVGGPQAIVDAMLAKLDATNLHLSHAVTQISKTNEGFEILSGSETLPAFSARRLVLAIPLRIAVETKGFVPVIPGHLKNEMLKTPTWMATHAKVACIFNSPFWREMGLSGRVASRIGPLAEMHDISGENGNPAVLFGFSGIPADVRATANLTELVIKQLIRCFGEKAARPIDIVVKDWSRELHICSKTDRSSPPEHPSPPDKGLRQGHLDNRLFFCISETSQNSTGLIDGALEAANRTAGQLMP